MRIRRSISGMLAAILMITSLPYNVVSVFAIENDNSFLLDDNSSDILLSESMDNGSAKEESLENTDKLDDELIRNNEESNENENVFLYNNADEEYYYYKPYTNATYELKYHIKDDGSIIIDGYRGIASGLLKIPDNINGMTVTTIGGGAFINCYDFTGNLIIPDSVTTISWAAFDGCSGFTGNLIIPGSVITIDDSAFNGCTGLTGELLIGKSVTVIGMDAFSGCAFTGNLVIPENVREIGDRAFRNCVGFTGNLTISEGVIKIGEYAFSDSSFTGGLIIPNSVTSIGRGVFFWCRNFSGQLTLGNGLKTISQDAFYYCDGFIGELVIPDSVTYIEPDAFHDCSGFTGNLTIPSSITTIGSGAFWGCKGLSGDLIIPDSVTGLGGQAFLFCEGFTGRLVISNSIDAIENGTFDGCTGLKGNLIIPEGITRIGECAFRDCGFTGNLIIPNNVTEIGTDAFYNCYGFTGNLRIPDSVKVIGRNAFSSCSGITDTITIGPDVEVIISPIIDDCEGIKRVINDSSAVISLPDIEGMEWTNFQDKKVVTEIANGTAIRSDYSSDEEYISGKLQEGETWSMRWKCYYSVNKETGEKSRPWLEIYMVGADLGDSYKYSYNSFDSDNEPWLKATDFGKNEFTKIRITGISKNPIYVVTNQFMGYSGIRSIELSHVYGVGVSAFEDCSSLQTIKGFDTSLYTIDASSFRNDSKLTTITGISKSGKLYNIGDEAFKGTNLNEITLNTSVKKIGKDAFDGCNNLVIRCYKDSASHKYAIENNIEFELLDDEIEGFDIISSSNGSYIDRSYFFPLGKSIEDIVFEKKSTEYNPRLAHMLSIMARSAYDENLAKKNYENMGFENIQQNHYLVDDSFFNGDPYAAYQIGYKTLNDGSTIVLITIRGTSNWMQWLHNIGITLASNTSLISHHIYFDSCANDLYSCLKAYMGGRIPKNNVTYIITGHSLGGAVGNLLSTKLLNNGVPQHNLYNYNFACPNVAIGRGGSSLWNKNGEYSNIINICNSVDPVPSIPGAFCENLSLDNALSIVKDSHWGKYGVTYWFCGNLLHNAVNEVDYLSEEKNENAFISVQNRVIAVGVFCPVDVVVKDSNDCLIASVIGGELNYYGKETGKKAIIITNKDGDKKILYLIGDDSYSVMLTGTDVGEMNYVMASTDLISGELYSVKKYEQVELTKGKEMLSDVQRESVEKTELFVLDEIGNPYKEVHEDGTEEDIKDDTIIPANKIELDPVQQDIKVGETFTITATILPSNITDKTVTWRSNNESVATVNSQGIVTGKGEGTATITATSSNGKKAECRVTVTAESVPQPSSDWGDLENYPDVKTLFKNVSDVPAGVWYAFKGNDGNYANYIHQDKPQLLNLSKDYTGGKIQFNSEIMVFYNTERLVEGRDYKISYANNIKPAQASVQGKSPAVTIRAKGNYYKGNTVFSFTIKQADTGAVPPKVRVVCKNTKPEYTGKPITLDELQIALYNEHNELLTSGQDYSFDDSQLKSVGTFALGFDLLSDNNIRVMSNPITVQPYNVKKHIKNGDSKVSIDVSAQTNVCKAGAEPKVTVKFDGKELREGVDYKLSFSKNKKLTNKAKVKILFTGYFSGSINEYFETIKKNVSELTVYAEDVKYKEKAGRFKVLPQILDNGKAVSKLRDIEKFKVDRGCEYYYADGEKKGQKIDDNAIVPANTLVEVRVNVKSRPNGMYTGEEVLSGFYRVYSAEKNIRKAKVTSKPIEYRNGAEIIPVNKTDFEIMMPGENTPLESEYFEIVSITQNRFIGTATIKIRGKNGYGGTKSFRIKIIKRKM